MPLAHSRVKHFFFGGREQAATAGELFAIALQEFCVNLPFHFAPGRFDINFRNKQIKASKWNLSICILLSRSAADLKSIGSAGPQHE